MARDRHFVALHRGGSLDLASHRLLASWAADCAEHVLPLLPASGDRGHACVGSRRDHGGSGARGGVPGACGGARGV